MWWLVMQGPEFGFIDLLVFALRRRKMNGALMILLVQLGQFLICHCNFE
jgi:hypothetical protein